MIKMVVSDIDGTLLNDKGQINQKTYSVLNDFQSEGGILVLATSRHLNECHEIKNRILSNNGFIISADGLYVHNAKFEKIKEFSFLDMDDLLSIRNLFSGCSIYVITNGIDYCVRGRLVIKEVLIDFLNNYIIRNKQKRYSITIERLNRIAPKVEKIIVKGTRIESVLSHIKGRFNYVILSDESIELRHIDTDKSIAALFLMNKFHFVNEEIAAFGDGQNDFELLSVFRTSFAMGNAIPEIKRIARYTIDSNNSNSIGDTLNALFEEDKQWLLKL